MTPKPREARALPSPHLQVPDDDDDAMLGQQLGPLAALQEDAEDPGHSFLPPPPTMGDVADPAPPPPTLQANNALQGMSHTPRIEDVGRPPSPRAEQQRQDLRAPPPGARPEVDNYSEDGEFDTPEEATPLGHIAKKMIAPAPMTPCPEDDILTNNPPPSSTGGAPSIYDLKSKSSFEPSALWDDEEFKAWMKTLSMGQKMRVQERLVIRAAVERAEQAIHALSSVEDKSDSAWLPTWEAAAQWSLGWFQEAEFSPYLRHLGFEVETNEKWSALPHNSGISLHIELLSHVQMAGHTWYQVNCQLKRSAGRGDMAWPAPRRLVQLRLDLHDRIKYILGSDYARLFGETRFAKYGAPPGTTARLRAWLDKLTNLINNGEVSPGVAAVALAFFQAPSIDGEQQQQPLAGALRQTGDSDSNLGGPSATPSVQGDSNYGGSHYGGLRNDFL